MIIGTAHAATDPGTPSNWSQFAWLLAPAVYALIQAAAEWVRAKARARKARKHAAS